MHKLFVLSFLALCSLGHAAEPPQALPWYFIKVDDGEKIHPEDPVDFVDTLVERYGFTELEGLQIIAGIYRTHRITYIAENGKALFCTKPPRAAKKKKAKCIIL